MKNQKAQKWYGSINTLAIYVGIYSLLHIATHIAQTQLMVGLGTTIAGESFRIFTLLFIWICLYTLSMATYFIYSFNIYRTLTTNIFEKLRSIEESALAHYGSGKLHTTVSNDLNTVLKLFLDYPANIITGTAIGIYILFLIGRYSIQTAFILIVLSTAYGLYGMWSTKVAKELYGHVRDVFRQKQNLTTMILKENTFLKVSISDTFFHQLVKDIIDKYRDTVQKWAVLSSSRNIMMNIMTVISTTICVYNMRENKAIAIALIGIIPMWFIQIDKIIGSVVGISKALIAMKHIEKLMNEEESRLISPDIPLDVKDMISIYGTHKPVSMTVNKGECILIKGDNGIGKSSLLKSLTGSLQRKSGCIKKGKGEFYYLPQNTLIIPCSVYENIKLDKDISPEKVEKLIDQLGLHPLFEDLPLDRELHPDKDTLSGGQKRAIDILRAALSNADIILMDEPESGVNDKYKNIFQQIVHTLKNIGKSLIIVSHSNWWEDVADSTVVLEKFR